MDIEIREKGFDAPQVVMDDLEINLHSRFGSGLFSSRLGKGFSCWDNQYRFSSDTVLQARSHQPVLELHIARRGIWQGQWDGIEGMDVRPLEFNLSYTPHVLTSARFRANMLYHSFDIHFEATYLQSLVSDFTSLENFLYAVEKRKATSISNRLHHCTREMTALVSSVLSRERNLLTPDLPVRSLLIAALEKVALDLDRPLPIITSKHRERLLHVKWLIEQADEGVQLKDLALKAGLNEYALKKGFPLLFGISPYGYHTQLKMERARRLLLDTQLPVLEIAYELGYTQSSSFGHEFRKWWGVSPGAFRKGESFND